jgi:broad specificity phosphatase PhoE
MSVHITYYVHGTTPYNEQGIASGQSDIGLSEQGVRDAEKLGKLTEGLVFDAVYTSDLPRAAETTRIAFGARYPVIQEPRLREIDDGIYTGTPIKEVPGPHLRFVTEQYPSGESFRDVEVRLRNLLDELKKTRDGQRVAFVAHFAPQMALDVILGGKTWEQAFAEDWRKSKAWQPGWEYTLS